MKAIDRVFSIITSEFPTDRVTTVQVAEAVGLTRGVTSSYLSKLEDEGKLIKSGTRPVYWQVKRDKTAFDDLIGADGSLSQCVQRAVEAIVFPNGGLPIFLTGPAGSGKNPFALAVYQEAVRRQVITKGSVFQGVDCSDFKHTMTELVETMKEIVDANSSKTDTVYLYVENLQEIDRKDIRQFIYASSRLARENVRLIYSSTEAIFNDVKDWWQSAIVNISLSAYLDRPLNERLAYVARYLQAQSNLLKRDILVSPKELKALTSFDDANNMRALGNHIQLLSAQAYAQATNGAALTIGRPGDDSVLVNHNGVPLTDQIQFLVTSMLSLSATADDLLKKLADSLNRNEAFAEQNFLVTKVIGLIDAVAGNHLVHSTVSHLKQAVESGITQRYGVKFKHDSSFWEEAALSLLFADVCVDNIDRKAETYALSKHVKARYPRSSYLFGKLLQKLDKDNANSEYYWLIFFVLMNDVVDEIESIQYNCLILTHGESTATSVQAVVNSLCGNYLFEAFDMPIDVPLDTVSDYVQTYLTTQGASAKGTIVLFDMGSLSQMFQRIKSVSDRELIVVNNVNTAMALDVGLRVQRNDSFQKIANACEEYGLATNAQYYEGLSNKKNIIVSCMSGVGLSRELKKIIDNTLTPSIEVIALDYKKLYVMLETHNRKFFANTQLILTTTDVEAVGLDSGVDIINAYNVFDKGAARKMTDILVKAGENRQSIDALIEELVRMLSIEGIRDRLQILNPDVVIKESQSIVEHYEDFYGVKYDSRLKLNLYMHLSLMIERMLISRHGPVNVIDRDMLVKEEKQFFDVSAGIFAAAEKRFNIKVQDYEIELLYQLLKDYNERR